jgi:hypothetical protein
VLLGGGVAVMLASCGDNESRARDCEKARAEMRPDAEQICRRSTSRSGSSWFFGRSGPGSSGAVSTPTQSSSSRSGFGSSARSSGGS